MTASVASRLGIDGAHGDGARGGSTARRCPGLGRAARATVTGALVLLTVAGCGDGGGTEKDTAARIPSATALVGTYDLTTIFAATAEPVLGVGSAWIDDHELHLALSVPPVSLHGALGSDGTAALEGTTTNSDPLSQVRGSARGERRGGMLRIVGSLEGALEGPADFTMERPVGADLSATSGHYRLTFSQSPGSCRCATTLDLSIANAGSGTTANDPIEVDPDGTAVAMLSLSFVDVAPSGRFVLETRYETSPGHCEVAGPILGEPCLLRLAGALPPPGRGALGSARFTLVSSLTLSLGSGDVAITRLDDAMM